MNNQTSDRGFVHGTLVLTEQGFKPIEQIAVGTRVLTEKQRWMPVAAIITAVAPVTKIAAGCHPGIQGSVDNEFMVTGKFAEHEAWVRPDQLRQAGQWRFLSPGRFDELPVPAMEQTSQIKVWAPVDEQLLRLAGCYVSRGTLDIAKLSDRSENRVSIFSKGQHVDEIKRIIGFSDVKPPANRQDRTGFYWSEQKTGNSHRLLTNSKSLVDWLFKNFGHISKHKSIPAWLIAAPSPLKEAFLTGYMGADKWVRNLESGTKAMEDTTVSKALAYSFRMLVSSMGCSSSIYYRANQVNKMQGRTIIVKDIYKIVWRRVAEGQSERNDLAFLPSKVRPIEATQQEVMPITSLTIREDAGYVVEGLLARS